MSGVAILPKLSRSSVTILSLVSGDWIVILGKPVIVSLVDATNSAPSAPLMGWALVTFMGGLGVPGFDPLAVFCQQPVVPVMPCSSRCPYGFCESHQRQYLCGDCARLVHQCVDLAPPFYESIRQLPKPGSWIIQWAPCLCSRRMRTGSSFLIRLISKLFLYFMGDDAFEDAPERPRRPVGLPQPLRNLRRIGPRSTVGNEEGVDAFFLTLIQLQHIVAFLVVNAPSRRDICLNTSIPNAGPNPSCSGSASTPATFGSTRPRGR